MAEQCGNCGSDITDGTVFKASNLRKTLAEIELVNVANSTQFADLCGKCGNDLVYLAGGKIARLATQKSQEFDNLVVHFPMFTVHSLPKNIFYKMKNLVTANVTVGTGIFNELSQGISDIFGVANEFTGMSHKVNKGEAAARSVLVRKAIGCDANCIIGVDLDYGSTANNSAMVNMQGTAIKVHNLEDLIDEVEAEKFRYLMGAFEELSRLRRWQRGEFSD